MGRRSAIGRSSETLNATTYHRSRCPISLQRAAGVLWQKMTEIGKIAWPAQSSLRGELAFRGRAPPWILLQKGRSCRFRSFFAIAKGSRQRDATPPVPLSRPLSRQRGIGRGKIPSFCRALGCGKIPVLLSRFRCAPIGPDAPPPQPVAPARGREATRRHRDDRGMTIGPEASPARSFYASLIRGF